MTGTLTFDDAATRQLDAVYSTDDVIAQRATTLGALGLRPGEKVVDLGAGPGYLAASMAEAVGPEGRVAGLDVSDSMLALAKRRCSASPGAEFQQADVTSLPFADAGFDVAVCIQVYEYVADVDTALREAHRVLRPGGRMAVMDTDWDSIVWAAQDLELAARILSVWDEHLVDRHLPRTLSRRMRAAGFDPPAVTVIPIFNTTMSDTYSGGMQKLVADFVAGRPGLSDGDVERWSADLNELDRRGEYFFSLNRYLFIASRA